MASRWPSRYRIRFCAARSSNPALRSLVAAWSRPAAAISRQNAPTALASVPEAGCAVADVTLAPFVASGVTLAGIESPANSSQAIGFVSAAGAGAARCARVVEGNPTIDATKTAAQAISL